MVEIQETAPAETPTPRLIMAAMFVQTYDTGTYGLFGAARRKTRAVVTLSDRARDYIRQFNCNTVDVVRAFVPKLVDYAAASRPGSSFPERFKIEPDADDDQNSGRVRFVLTGRNLKGFEIRAAVDLADVVGPGLSDA